MKLTKITLTLSFFLFSALVAFSQKGVEDGSKWGHGEDSIRCIRNYSLYLEYYKQKNYEDALPYWRIVAMECPKATKNIYLHGANMYKFYIVEAMNNNDTELKNALVDSLLKVYDQRIQYYPGDKGRVLGYKANDILTFKENDVECLKRAYGFSSEGLDIQEARASKVDIATFMKLTLDLFNSNQMSKTEVVENYALSVDILDAQILNNPEDEELDALKESIGANFANSGAADCEALVQLFTPQFEEQPDNVDILKKISYWLNSTGCTDTELYKNTTIALNMVEPSPTLAYHIAQLYNKEKRYQDAVEFYYQAIEQETDPLVRSRYRVELGYIIYSEYNDPLQAKQIAMKAIADNPDSGQPHMLLGNIYAGTKNFGEDELANKAVFWAAVDQFVTAKSKDSELADMANEKIRLYSQYFPDTETAFFYGFKEGDSYSLGGWINVTTTVRIRQ